MEKLPMCRICLAENVRMYVIVNRDLHELYEKLTDIQFVTEDIRPILACFFCCAKLKQCYRLLRQCLEAEELFAQMMNDDYEPNPLIKQDHFEFLSGFIISPIVHISIDDECQTESIAIKEELPAVCEGLDDIIKPEEEHQSDELEPENVDNSCLDVANIPPHDSESDLEDNVPLMEFETEVEEEQEVSNKKQRARETKKLEVGNADNSCLDVADIPPHDSESDLEDDVPLMEFETDVEEAQEVSNKKRRARQTTSKGTTVAKKPKLDTRRIKLEDAITAEQTKMENSDSKVIRTTQKRTSKPDTYLKKSYKCDLRNFNRVKKNIQHIGTQSDGKPKCDICQRSFSNKGGLTQHIRIHTGEKPYKCDVCQRSFTEKGGLNRHVRIHTGEKPYQCDVCQRCFSLKAGLNKHIRIHTGQKPYKCDVCQRSFCLKSYLSKHILLHAGQKPYKCDVCQRCFSDKGRLKKHNRIHTGQKPYKCDICQRSFSDKSNLTKHIRLHTGEKPYQCDVCQRCFSVKGNFNKHVRIHAGQKPYKCDLCQSSFNENSDLTKHICVHTGEKSYQCDVCQRCFSVKGSFNKHIRIHTGQKPYKCDVCQRSFNQKYNLKKHIRIHNR